MSADVLDGLSEIDAANVVRCARVLLRRPLLRVGGPDGDLLPLVYRHRASLVDLFTQALGYRLVVQRQFARLYKAYPQPPHPGAIPGTDLPRAESGLNPLGYAYLALTIAALTGAGRQVLLSRLVADVRAATAEAGIDSTDDVADRRALAAALRHLVALGVITETEGSVGGLLGETPTEALITIDTDLLGQLLVGPLAEAESVDELLALAARPGPRGIEHAVRRRGRRESAMLERCFGLVTETRAEGVAVTDPEDYLTDLVFPGTGTVARIALLALPELLADPEPALDDAEPEPRADGQIPVTVGQVRLACQRLVVDYPAAWSKQATENIADLADDVLALLRAAGLARPDPESETGGWLLSPAAHRWQPEPDERPAREIPVFAPEPEPEPGWSLFDEEGT